MQILGKIFNALLFVSAMGGIFCVLSLFAARVLRCALPLWVPLCGMALFCVPILSPEVSLLSPERQDWLSGYRIACWIWAGGCGVFLLCDIVRAALAKRALKGYPRCNNERITAICAHCAQTIGLKKAPALYYGTLENPVCITGAIRPALLMDKAIVERLNDTELSAVFFHELTHVKRRHLLWERIYDVVCLANWSTLLPGSPGGSSRFIAKWIAMTRPSRLRRGKWRRGNMLWPSCACWNCPRSGLRSREGALARSAFCWQSAGCNGSPQNLQRSGNGCYARYWRFRWRLRWRFPCDSAGNTFIPIRPIALARNIPRVAACDPFFSTIKLLL